MRNDRGDTTTEHLGVLTLVAAIIVVLIATGVAGQLGGGVAAAICRIVHMGKDAGCGGANGRWLNPFLPATPCAQSTDNGGMDADVTFFSVHLGGKVQYVKEKMSDGTWKVTLKVGGGDGLRGEVGGSAEVSVGGTSAGGGADLSGKVLLTGESGRTWYFKTQDEANNFVGAAEGDLAWSAPKTVADNILPVIGGWAVGKLQDVVGMGFNPPRPDEVYFQGGLQLSGAADFGDGNVSAELGGSLGAKVSYRKNTVTAYFKVDGKVAGNLGLGGAEGTGSMQVGLVYARGANGNLHPLALQVTGIVGATGILTLKDPINEQLKSVLKGQSGVGGTLTANLPLDDPQNAQAAKDFMAALAGGSLPDAISSGASLVDRFDNHGQVSFVAYDQSKMNFGAEGNFGEGVELGLGAHVFGNTQQATGAWYHDPTAGGWVPWPMCAG